MIFEIVLLPYDLRGPEFRSTIVRHTDEWGIVLRPSGARTKSFATCLRAHGQYTFLLRIGHL